MHLLYYGSQQEKLLHTERALKLLEEQSTKMGLQYDDPKSVDHIIPFVRRFSISFVQHLALLHLHVPHEHGRPLKPPFLDPATRPCCAWHI
jgi:hypothetical protein